ncbi:hypothetical protein Tco_1424376, partial [Tanacetum coccineum]
EEVLKLKNIKKDGYTHFQTQEQYEHVGPEVTRSQEGKRSQDDNKRLCLVDDLKEFKITFMSSQRYNPKPKVKDHYIHSQVKDCELKNKVKSTKKYAELSDAKKIQADCDMKATNIILQGLLADIYSLHERECKMYDAFDKFTHIKEETRHKYYLRFTQLINDMNIYNIKIEIFQVNIKFLNNLPPEWSKFVTDVKLVKDFHTTNFDQLHAYVEQYELHANEVCLLRERNQDPLAFVANQQMTPPHFNTYQSSYNNPQLQQQFPPSQYRSIHPTQHYSSTYPSQPQFNHSSIPPSYPYQSQMNHQTSSVP